LSQADLISQKPEVCPKSGFAAVPGVVLGEAALQITRRADIEMAVLKAEDVNGMLRLLNASSEDKTSERPGG